MTVSRETLGRLEALATHYGLPQGGASSLAALLRALVAEPDPPTTVRDPGRAAEEHLADSLSGLEVAELRSASRIADLGAGAGFPGLPLALALPQSGVDLIDSTARKAEVIGRLATACGARNARALAVRAEELAAGEGREAYGAVTARAVAPLPVLAEYAAPLLFEGGVLVAWKGRRDPAEESAASRAAERTGMEPLRVLEVRPFPGARSRHLHVLGKAGPTPPRLPRRPGMARKRPLA